MTGDPRAAVLPSVEDPVVRRLSEGVGGPAGRRIAPGSWWTPVRVALVLVFLASGLGVLAKQHCRAEGWNTPDQFVHACYSDIPHLFHSRALARGEVPYLAEVGPDEQVEYPVLTGVVMYATAVLVPDSPDPAERSRRYFDVNVLLIAVCAAGTVILTARTAGHRPWDAVMVAVAPGLVLAGTVNWDMWAVLLTSAAMWAWARERPVAAGVWLGLATATKFYPLLLLGPLFLVCLRAGRLGAFARTVAAGAGAWLAVNLPFMVGNFEGWARFYRLSQERGAGFSSIWFVLDQQGLKLEAPVLNRVATLTLLACCIAIAGLALSAPRRPRLPQLAFLTVAAFLLTNKVYSPQYVMWLLPLAVLARPRWRDVLIWQVCEVIHFFGIWYLLAGYDPGRADRALNATGYGITVAIHVAGTLWLAALVVRDVLDPQQDPVRSGGADDPAGGVVDAAPDTPAFGGGGGGGDGDGDP
ncbi:MAG: glycosyltransferase 87 family protein, partial [Actinomycetota bacterium]|nr:glycosyltransferase 87 family protein [Actinomycetota bacterium]